MDEKPKFFEEDEFELTDNSSTEEDDDQYNLYKQEDFEGQDPEYYNDILN